MCWGQNWDGQFGNGSANAGSLAPVAASNVPADAVAITAGQNHTCALRSGGSVVCWGFNGGGETGDGTTTTPKTSPGSAIGLSDVKAIASGPYFNCAVMTGKVFCWGQVPLSGASVSTPAEVPSVSGVTAIAAGANHVCAVRSDSTVVCWGSNTLGQLGNGATAYYGFGIGPIGGAPNSSSTPGAVQFHTSTTTKVNLTGAVAVAAGQYHSCALMNDAKVKCWGDNQNGALGATSQAPWAAFIASQTSAIEVDGVAGVTQLVAGKSFNCALLTNKNVKCWGANTYGQLGQGSKSASAGPALVGGSTTPLSNVVAITAGETHACALLGSGDVKCWGANGTYGNLGNSSTSESLSPVSTLGGPVFGR